MISYRDRTYCTAACGTTACPVRLTADIVADAERVGRVHDICHAGLSEDCDEWTEPAVPDAMKTIELSPDVDQSHPAGWLVFDSAGDAFVFASLIDAEDFAAAEEESLVDCDERCVIYPLWAGIPQTGIPYIDKSLIHESD